MPNRLAQEKSPYLLQHAQNPVDWYSWGDDAFRRAREEDRPIFLSIGYATCHWCHVMEHESFEDEGVARLLNDHFVSIKVDREERPDIDQIYMIVCQIINGSGGWPLSIFMTPDRKPFFAGTYFPKSSRMGMPGFVDILGQIGNLWKDDRERLFKAGEQITAAIQPQKGTSSRTTLALETLQKAYEQLQHSFDPQWGGFGSAPKFPTPHHLTFLLRWHRRQPTSDALSIVEKTLDAMRSGGIFDHLGFGFHRYSVDERWLVPHFEKMLYDQALLAMTATETYQLTGHERHAQTAREIFTYVLRDMTAAEGGFNSAEDADSEGKEGLFYVWTPAEVKSILGDEVGEIFCRVHDITAEGNFEEQRSIPHMPHPLATWAGRWDMTAEQLETTLEDARRKLLDARSRRIPPLKDDKVLTSWNGLMIAALARGYQALGEKTYLEAARRAARFLLNGLRSESGRLYRRYREGERAHAAFADDYAFLVWGLLDLYEATFEVPFLAEAITLQRDMVDLFGDDDGGGFFFTARDGEPQIVRDKEIYDGAVPSSNSVALLNMLRLARMTGDTAWEDRGERLMAAFSGLVSDYPSAYTQFLNALDFALGPCQEIVVAGKREDPLTEAMIDAVRRPFLPGRVLLHHSGGENGGQGRLADVAPFVDSMHPLNGHPTVYLCEKFSCRQPITQLEDLREAVRRMT